MTLRRNFPSVWFAHAGPLTQKISFAYIFADGA